MLVKKYNFFSFSDLFPTNVDYYMLIFNIFTKITYSLKSNLAMFFKFVKRISFLFFDQEINILLEEMEKPLTNIFQIITVRFLND